MDDGKKTILEKPILVWKALPYKQGLGSGSSRTKISRTFKSYLANINEPKQNRLHEQITEVSNHTNMEWRGSV